MDYLAIIVNHWATVAIASAILLLLYIWGVAPYNTLSDLFKNVPGPTPWPFVGHLLDTLRHKMQIHLQMDEYYKKYGRLYKMYLFGKVPCLVVGDPEMVKDILVKEFDSFSDRPVSCLIYVAIALQGTVKNRFICSYYYSGVKSMYSDSVQLYLLCLHIGFASRSDKQKKKIVKLAVSLRYEVRSWCRWNFSLILDLNIIINCVSLYIINSLFFPPMAQLFFTHCARVYPEK